MSYDEKRCEERRKNCDGRFCALEDAVHDINDPKEGAISRLHEKINRFGEAVGSRLKTGIFVTFVVFIMGSIGGSYAYTHKVEQNQNGYVKIQDFERLENDIKNLNSLTEQIRGLRDDLQKIKKEESR